MITLQRFERLVSAPLAQKPVAFTFFRDKGEGLEAWAATLPMKSKHEQYEQLRVVLSELLVSDMSDGERLAVMNQLMPVVEGVIKQLHSDYIYENQSLSSEQQSSIYEVRSLYFLLILIYRNVALRHQNIKKVNAVDGKKWLNKIMPTKKSKILTLDEDILTCGIHQMMALYVKLLLEYALSYQRVPKVIWQEINAWYLKALSVGIHHISMDEIAQGYPEMSIHDQYMQACGASFGNLFAYRRQDILNAFDILPSWAKYFKTTFEARPEFRVFVNLQGSEPPEVITPYASVNPYSDEYHCLFFDLRNFVKHIEQVLAGVYLDGGVLSLFEARFAKMVLLAFEQRTLQERQAERYGHKSELLVGFAAIFNEVAGGRNLSSIIHERSLPAEFHVRMNAATLGMTAAKEIASVTYKNNAVIRFRFGEDKERDEQDEVLPSCPILHVYGLFALKSPKSTNKNPWRIGMAHWVDKMDNGVFVDGRFLGRALMAVGIRLKRRDGRSQEFVHALLIGGDELNEQSKLIMPRYHFKTGDYVVLRIDNKEMELRLERNILTTDEIEQYQIVRLTG